MHEWFQRNPQTVVVGTRKGGTGKTITSVSFASFCASLGLRTAYLATDPNANGILCLGLKSPRYVNEAGQGLYDALINGDEWEPLEIEDELARPNLDIFGAGHWTAKARDILTASRLDSYAKGGDLPHFADVLDQAQSKYHIVVVDTGADFANQTEQDTLECADLVISPTNTPDFEITGILGTVDTISAWFEINEAEGEMPPVVALLNNVDRSATRLEREAREQLEDAGIAVFDTRIGQSKADLQAMYKLGKTAFDLHPSINYLDDPSESKPRPGFTTGLHRELAEFGIEVMERLVATNKGIK